MVREREAHADLRGQLRFREVEVRPGALEVETEELGILQAYLPQELTETEVAFEWIGEAP